MLVIQRCELILAKKGGNSFREDSNMQLNLDKHDTYNTNYSKCPLDLHSNPPLAPLNKPFDHVD